MASFIIFLSKFTFHRDKREFWRAWPFREVLVEISQTAYIWCCRRRSKSHRSSLHSYCVSGSRRAGGQLYDDLYLAGHLPRLANNYTTTTNTNNTFYNRNQVGKTGCRSCSKSIFFDFLTTKPCDSNNVRILSLFVPAFNCVKRHVTRALNTFKGWQSKAGRWLTS